MSKLHGHWALKLMCRVNYADCSKVCMISFISVEIGIMCMCLHSRKLLPLLDVRPIPEVVHLLGAVHYYFQVPPDLSQVGKKFREDADARLRYQ